MLWKIIEIIINITLYVILVVFGFSILNMFYDLCKNVEEIKEKLEIE